MKIEVTYMSGAGNTFTVIDNRKYNLEDEFWSSRATILCSKNEFNKLPTEGLIILNESDNQDFAVSFFNPDGSSEMMCGNGGRCAVFFAANKDFFENKKKIVFKMAGNNYKADLKNNIVQLSFPPPLEIKNLIDLKTENLSSIGTYVNVGSDHYCIDYKTLSLYQEKPFRDFCIDSYAPKMRFHDKFAPNGVNVNFYMIDDDSRVHLRTYERGVEAETGACGTGALSTAVTIKEQIPNMRTPITIIPPSGIELSVDFNYNENNEISELILVGNAEIKQSAEIEIPDILYEEK